MIGLDKILGTVEKAKKGDNMLSLYEKNKDCVKNYHYLLFIVNALEKNGVILTKKVGHDRVIFWVKKKPLKEYLRIAKNEALNQ